VWRKTAPTAASVARPTWATDTAVYVCCNNSNTSFSHRNEVTVLLVCRIYVLNLIKDSCTRKIIINIS